MDDDEAREERMADYDRRRREAIRAIKAARGPNPDALPLSEVVALLPDHPEWVEYTTQKRGRPRG